MKIAVDRDVLVQRVQDAEPVAMYMGHRHTPADTTEFWGFSENRMAKGTSLYTHPAPKHTPLTDEQIDVITISQWGDMRGFPLAAHRAYAREGSRDAARTDQAMDQATSQMTPKLTGSAGPLDRRVRHQRMSNKIA